MASTIGPMVPEQNQRRAAVDHDCSHYACVACPLLSEDASQRE